MRGKSDHVVKALRSSVYAVEKWRRFIMSYIDDDDDVPEDTATVYCQSKKDFLPTNSTVVIAAQCKLEHS